MKKPTRRRITVFSPTPCLTVTVEAGAASAEELHLHAGGQGVWVARLLKRFGVPVTLCVPLGGDSGNVVESLLESEGIACRVERVSAVTGAYVHDRRDGTRREVCSIDSPPLDRHESDDFFNAALTSALDAEIGALAGQFPRPVIESSAYFRLASDLSRNGCLVVADLSGEDLRQALKGGVHILSISDEEVVSSGFAPRQGEAGMRRGLLALRDAGARSVVIHRADKPGLALIGALVYEVVVPRMEPRDHRGGGDAFFSGMLAGLSRGWTLRRALSLAGAAGALNVTRSGLGTGRAEDIESLRKRIVVRRVGTVRALTRGRTTRSARRARVRARRP